MARAFLKLYEATGERRWLAQAESAAAFMAARFGPADTAGFPTVTPSDEPGERPRPQVDENIAAARFFNLLFRYTGNDTYRVMSNRAMRFLAAPEIARGRGFFVAGILLADSELSAEPIHVTVVGGKADPAAQKLFAAAIAAPTSYKRIEWWDRGEGPLANSDVDFPQLNSAAAYLCANGSCSSPMIDPSRLAARLAKIRN